MVNGGAVPSRRGMTIPWLSFSDGQLDASTNAFFLEGLRERPSRHAEAYWADRTIRAEAEDRVALAIIAHECAQWRKAPTMDASFRDDAIALFALPGIGLRCESVSGLFRNQRMTGSPWKRRREGGETPKPTSIISRGLCVGTVPIWKPNGSSTKPRPASPVSVMGLCSP